MDIVTDVTFTSLQVHGVNTIEIFTDGAVRNYGKPHTVSGYGIYIPGWLKVSISGDAMMMGDRTITMMEFQAIRHSLSIMETVYKHGWQGTVTIKTDSKFVVDAITKLSIVWQRKHWINHQGHKIVYKDIIMECFEILATINRYIDVTKVIVWDHVKSHSGIEGNEIADTLAKLGCDRMQLTLSQDGTVNRHDH